MLLGFTLAGPPCSFQLLRLVGCGLAATSQCLVVRHAGLYCRRAAFTDRRPVVYNSPPALLIVNDSCSMAKRGQPIRMEPRSILVDG